MALQEAVLALDETVAALLNAQEKDTSPVLAAAFKLNNEIGRKLGQSGNSDLKKLQLLVNEVVVAAKKLDTARLAVAMGRVRAEYLQKQDSG